MQVGVVGRLASKKGGKVAQLGDGYCDRAVSSPSLLSVGAWPLFRSFWCRQHRLARERCCIPALSLSAWLRLHSWAVRCGDHNLVTRSGVARRGAPTAPKERVRASGAPLLSGRALLASGSPESGPCEASWSPSASSGLQRIWPLTCRQCGVERNGEAARPGVRVVVGLKGRAGTRGRRYACRSRAHRTGRTGVIKNLKTLYCQRLIRVGAVRKAGGANALTSRVGT